MGGSFTPYSLPDAYSLPIHEEEGDGGREG
jgi:hypothetical protein